jgi:hypothetical protein
MYHMMTEAKKILDPIIVGVGTVTTGWLAWFSNSTVTGIKDTITILVGLATLIYTVYKILEIRAERKERLEAETNE